MLIPTVPSAFERLLLRKLTKFCPHNLTKLTYTLINALAAPLYYSGGSTRAIYKPYTQLVVTSYSYVFDTQNKWFSNTNRI